MERKTFLGTVAATAAVAAAPTIAAAQPNFNNLSNRNITYMMKIVQATIDDLQGDASDYGGYRVRAIQNLQNAHANLNAALEHVGM